MIVVKVELWSAITGKKTTLYNLTLTNDGTGTYERGNYDVAAFRKGKEINSKPCRKARYEDHDRLNLHILTLLRRALQALGY